MKTGHQISQTAFIDARVARNAHPDETIEMVRDEPWARNLAVVCPGCGVIFYGYQCQNRKFQDGYVDPDPPIIDPGMADGRRRTCGHPACEYGENEKQLGRSNNYTKTKETYYTAKQSDTFTPKPKAGGLKRL